MEFRVYVSDEMGTTISPLVRSLSRSSVLPVLPFHPSVSYRLPRQSSVSCKNFTGERVACRCQADRSLKISCKNFTTVRVACRVNSDESGESMFMDENGFIEDVDGYLNYLSLEYDSVWDTKPAWCQPWTITLTGVSAIAFSWVILHSMLATGTVFLLTGAWWYIFLYSYPKAYSEMIAKRKKKVTDGVEDTYGQRTRR